MHNQAFTGGNVQSKLEFLTKAFVNNASFNQLENNSIQISKIFEWYSVDFDDIKSFLNKYSNAPVGDASISFKNYDWTLNGE